MFKDIFCQIYRIDAACHIKQRINVAVVFKYGLLELFIVKRQLLLCILFCRRAVQNSLKGKDNMVKSAVFVSVNGNNGKTAV